MKPEAFKLGAIYWKHESFQSSRMNQGDQVNGRGEDDFKILVFDIWWMINIVFYEKNSIISIS